MLLSSHVRPFLRHELEALKLFNQLLMARAEEKVLIASHAAVLAGSMHGAEPSVLKDQRPEAVQIYGHGELDIYPLTVARQLVNIM
jgi:hypothetical protein